MGRGSDLPSHFHLGFFLPLPYSLTHSHTIKCIVHTGAHTSTHIPLSHNPYSPVFSCTNTHMPRRRFFILSSLFLCFLCRSPCSPASLSSSQSWKLWIVSRRNFSSSRLSITGTHTVLHAGVVYAQIWMHTVYILVYLKIIHILFVIFILHTGWIILSKREEHGVNHEKSMFHKIFSALNITLKQHIL